MFTVCSHTSSQLIFKISLERGPGWILWSPFQKWRNLCPEWLDDLPGLAQQVKIDLQLKPILCSFYNSTDPPLHGGDTDHTLGSWPRSSPGYEARSLGKFSSITRPSVCLTFGISEPTPNSESTYMLAVKQRMKHLIALISLFVLSDNYQPSSYS